MSPGLRAPSPLMRRQQPRTEADGQPRAGAERAAQRVGRRGRSGAERAPQAEIQDLKRRHRWEHIAWYTITDDFDKDFDVGEWHGTNAFLREDDRIFRTYLINARGDEQMGNTWNYLDITALGRQEAWENSPEGYPQTPPYQWWNYHDAYTEAK